jgi:hypothetical protein
MEPSSYSDNTLEAYLNDELPDDQLAAFEDELLRDEALFERLQTVETNIIDRYLEDEMAGEEKRRFEAGFLSYPDNERKLDEARVFRESLALLRKKESPAGNVAQFPVTKRSFLSSVRLPQIAAAAVVLILIGIFLAWLLFRAPNQNLTSMSTKVTPAPTPDNSSPTPPHEQPSPSPNRQRSTNRIREKWLYLKEGASGVMGSDDELYLTTSPDTDVLRLRFELIDDTRTKDLFRVTVKDQMGYPIFPSPGTIDVKPISTRYRGHVRRAISIDVPVSKLKLGERYRFEIAEPYAFQIFVVDNGRR